MKKTSIGVCILEISKLYRYNSNTNTIQEYNVIKQSAQRVWLYPPPENSQTANINEIGKSYFFTEEQAFRIGIMKDAVDYWMDLMNRIEMT